jgi:hypothetical protein
VDQCEYFLDENIRSRNRSPAGGTRMPPPFLLSREAGRMHPTGRAGPASVDGVPRDSDPCRCCDGPKFPDANTRYSVPKSVEVAEVRVFLGRNCEYEHFLRKKSAI